MRILLTRWGILRFHSILSMYVNWEIIEHAIQNESVIFSKWFFKMLPKIFKDSYVLYVGEGIKNTGIVKHLIKKLEEIEEIELPEEIKQEIMDVASEHIDSGQPLWKRFNVEI